VATCTEESTSSSSVMLTGTANAELSGANLMITGDTYQIYFRTLGGLLSGTQIGHSSATYTPAGGSNDSNDPATGMFYSVTLTLEGTIDPTKPGMLQGSKAFPTPGVPPRIYSVNWNFTQN
jgi:hypothetical protein